MCIKIILVTSLLITQNIGLRLIELPDLVEQKDVIIDVTDSKIDEVPEIPTTEGTDMSLLFGDSVKRADSLEKSRRLGSYDQEKDINIKIKIATLVQQTLHDVNKKIELIEPLKESFRTTVPYRIGYVLSMIKKSRDIMNELFNISVKHRDQWKSLEQLKIFELIVHTNVDTTNLVRQLVEIHMSNQEVAKESEKNGDFLRNHH